MNGPALELARNVRRSMKSAVSPLNLAAVEAAARYSNPYTYFVGAGLIEPGSVDEISRDFPVLRGAGFLTLDRIDVTGAFKRLIDALNSGEFRRVVEEALGLTLEGRPSLITVMRWCPKRAGRIHTDSASKLATVLVYLNPAWKAGSSGALRILRSADNFADNADEIVPLMGNVVGFVRSDRSWHGHLPFQGERRVVQMTWLRDEEDAARKRRNNLLAQALKSVRFWPEHQQHSMD